MPALVPAGYTRGAIVFLGDTTSKHAQERLLQRFWNEAGAFGSRILIVACERGEPTHATAIASVLAEWEGESVETLTLQSRASAMESTGIDLVARATGILIVGDDALGMAGVLGGTALAQAMRRANAQGKVVCGMGSGAGLLCQHMAMATAASGATPLVHRGRVQFAPGLGIVNRIVLDSPSASALGSNSPETPDASPAHAAQPAQTDAPLGLLLSAVAYNPFLVGMHLQEDTGAVVYPNTTLEVFGDRSALLVDGLHMLHTSLPDAPMGESASVLGVQLHVLSRGCTFNFDTREVSAPAKGDLKLRTEAVKAAF